MTIRIKIRPLNVDDVAEDIENAIERGVSAGGGEVIDHTETIAKRTIRERGFVSRGRKGGLLASFEQTTPSRPVKIWHGSLKNVADHARPIEEGAEYTDRGPPVLALVPWVTREMHGFEVPEGWSPDGDAVEQAFAREDWTDVNVLADSETIRKAFWLQEYIKEHDIPDAVHYMRNAQLWAEKRGDEEVAKQISAHFRAL